ncbi:hypothetical protein [Endothiovibrio diazotrophicus]
MGILDELRQEADQLKNQELEERRRKEEIERRFREEIDPKMQQLHAYLREVVQQLNVVKPEIPVDYEIAGKPLLKGLNQGDYFLGHYAERKFTLQFVCTRELKQVFEINEAGQINRMKEYLTNNAVKYHCKELMNDRHEVYKATFVLLGQVKGALEFRANPGDGCVDLLARNFSSLGRATVSFPPEKIDSAFCDQLGNYLLRRSNKVLEHRIQRMSEEQRATIRRNLEKEKQEREAELKRIEEEEKARKAAEKDGKGSLLGKLLGRKG